MKACGVGAASPSIRAVYPVRGHLSAGVRVHAQAMVPLASALARGGGCRVSVLVSVCSAVTAGRCARLLILGIVLRSGGVCVRVNLRFFWGAFVSCCFACGCVLELVVCRVRFPGACTVSLT